MGFRWSLGGWKTLDGRWKGCASWVHWQLLTAYYLIDSSQKFGPRFGFLSLWRESKEPVMKRHVKDTIINVPNYLNSAQTTLV